MDHSKKYYISILKLIFMISGIFAHSEIICQKLASDFEIIDSKDRYHRLYQDYLDQGKIVVVDLFFADCPPCNTIAPYLKESYEKWGGGLEKVQFIGLSPFDNNLAIRLFQENHRLSYPAAGTEGKVTQAIEQFTNGTFGPFDGYPVLILIKPDGEVIYDIFSSRGDSAKIALLDFYIEESLKESIEVFSLELWPNPAKNQVNGRVYIPDSRPFDLSIINIKGSLMRKIHTDKNANYICEFSIENLPSGQYYLKLESDTEIITKAFIIL